MTVTGSLVRLRAMDPADAEAQHRWLNDPVVTKHLPSRYPVSLTAVAGRLEGAGTMTFANPRFSVERLDTGALVGWAALRDVTPESRNAEVELVVGDRASWGIGIGTDTVATVTAFGFERLGLHRAHAWVLAGHDAALRVFEKAGYEREVVARHRVWRHGVWHDCVLLARLAP